MSAPEGGITAAQARAEADAEHARQREAEAACRLDFLVYGVDGDEEHGPHAERCICSPKCSRDYDPLPYPEAEPVDAKLYAGTSIGALYGLGGSVEHVWKDDDGNLVRVESALLADLAGWNLTYRSDRYE